MTEPVDLRLRGTRLEWCRTCAAGAVRIATEVGSNTSESAHS